MRPGFSRRGAPEAFLYAFGVLELEGRDLRNESWDVEAARQPLPLGTLAGLDQGQEHGASGH
jgi:hypothetical protein